MDRILRVFDADSDWRRPLPAGYLRTDAIVAGAAFLVAALALELVRSVGALGSVSQPLWQQYLAVGSAAALLVGRRRYPVTVGAAAAIHLVVVGTLQPVVMGQTSQQVLYFVAVYSAVAWARDRRLLTATAALVTLVLVGWVVWYFALGQGIQEVLDTVEERESPSVGVLGPVPAFILYTSLLNVAYFGGAAALGVMSWRSARARALTAEQAATIAGHAEQQRERAVVDERLRIARELHDVVAHHVAAMGVQAGAARTVLPTDPDRAAAALRTVEDSSRTAVEEMRSLLGTLRDPEDGDDGAGTSRRSEPGLADLGSLVERFHGPGFRAELAEAVDPAVPVDAVPAAIGLSLYRTAQESLANVRRHSTADTARVTLRTGLDRARRYAEIEVIDDGRPRTGTSGSGVGLLGMRERVASHRGTCEIGPRVTGGYRVRVRLPLGEGS
ncbi:sensor histidine kinase [Dietzia sp. 179-F 9C3 NHS]|uniref:sensor histidine kinase n=1 Tax=Dietzia sp. 179-F 9C3 NHS TaxID=3374295 RepID=UPI003879978A